MASFTEYIIAFLGKIGIFIGILSSANTYSNVEYVNGDGDNLFAYLALPPDYNETQTYPTALVFHAWNGMSDEPVYFADLLAEQGYIALAPDLYRGVASPELLIPWNILSVITAPQDRMDADVDLAIEYLEGMGSADMSRLVSGPGFCFGGAQALELAKRKAVAATVSLYGSSISELTTDAPDEYWGLIGVDGSPILGIYGEEDMGPSPDQVVKFTAAMVERGILHNTTIYEGVGHAFVNPDAHSSANTQAVTAWDQVVEFMLEVAQGDGMSRRTKEMHLSHRVHTYRSPLSWFVDHATDGVYHKGHANHLHGG